MKVLLCGHELSVNERLSKIIHELGYVAITAEDSHIFEVIKNRQPEVLLFHATMPNLDTLCQQISEKLLYRPAMIWIGQAQQCTQAAFCAGVHDYLLSPVSKEALQMSLAKVCQLNAAQTWLLAKKPTNERRVRQYIAARTHRGVEMIAIENVYYFAADQKYVKVRHKEGTVLIDETLKGLEEEFGGIMFRIHRGALVNLEYLDVLELVNSRHYQVRLRGINETLSVSRRYLPALREKIYSI